MLFGAVGVLCYPLAYDLAQWWESIESSRVILEPVDISDYATYEKVTLIVAVVGSLLLVVFSFGLLGLRDWARKGLIIFQIVNLAEVGGSYCLAVYWLIPAEIAAGIRSDAYGCAIGHLVIGAWRLAWLMLYLVVLTRPMIKVQFGHQLKEGAPIETGSQIA